MRNYELKLLPKLPGTERLDCMINDADMYQRYVLKEKERKQIRKVENRLMLFSLGLLVGIVGVNLGYHSFKDDFQKSQLPQEIRPYDFNKDNMLEPFETELMLRNYQKK